MAKRVQLLISKSMLIHSVDSRHMEGRSLTTGNFHILLVLLPFVAFLFSVKLRHFDKIKLQTNNFLGLTIFLVLHGAIKMLAL